MIESLYFVIGLIWIIYLSQEAYICGSALVNAFIKDYGMKKQIQVSSGIHWDGVQVWMIVALMATFAAFPYAYANIFEGLYVVIFLLLYAMIARALSIELLFKNDSKRWLKTFSKIWTASSFFLFLFLAIYFANLFIGFDITDKKFKEVFFPFYLMGMLTNVVVIFFLTTSYLLGALWIIIRCTGEIRKLAMRKINVVAGFSAIFAVGSLLGYSTKTEIFVGELYSKSLFFFALPALCMVCAISYLIFTYLKHYKTAYALASTTIVLWFTSLYVGVFPYVVPSRHSFDDGFSIYYKQNSHFSLQIILVILVITIPLGLIYQIYKHIKFSKRIYYYDNQFEEERKN